MTIDYTAGNYNLSRFIETGLNNVVLSTLFIVVNNIEQYSIMSLNQMQRCNNIVDNDEQCGQQNIV